MNNDADIRTVLNLQENLEEFMKRPEGVSRSSGAALSRRAFLRMCGGASLALAGGVGPAAVQASTERQKREIGKPKVAIRNVEKSAEEPFFVKLSDVFPVVFR